MLGGNVLVLEPLSLALRPVEGLRHGVRDVGLAARDARKTLDVGDQRSLGSLDRDAAAFQKRARETALLAQKSQREVLGLDRLLA